MAVEKIVAGFEKACRSLEKVTGRSMASLVLQQAGMSGGAAFSRTLKLLSGSRAQVLAWPACLAAWTAVGFGSWGLDSLEWPHGPIRVQADLTWETITDPRTAVLEPLSNSSEPVCSYTAGALAGFAAGLSGHPGWIASERTCRVQGAALCRFELRPATKTGPWAAPVFDPWFPLDPGYNWLERCLAWRPIGVGWFDLELGLGGGDANSLPWLFQVGGQLRSALESAREGESVELAAGAGLPPLRLIPLQVGEAIVGVGALFFPVSGDDVALIGEEPGVDSETGPEVEGDLVQQEVPASSLPVDGPQPFGLAIEKLITEISSHFINVIPDEVDAEICYALQTVGEFARAHRSYVFMYSSNGKMMDNTHEWCAPGVRSQKERRQNIQIADFSWSNGLLMRGEVMYVSMLDDLPPEAEPERQEFSSQQMCAAIAVPVVFQGKTIGFLGIDAVQPQAPWPKELIALLKSVGEVFIHALNHKQAREVLMQAYQNLEQRVAERTNELQTLFAVQQALTSHLDLDAVLQLIAEAAQRLTEAQRAVVFLLHDGEELVLSFVAGETYPDTMPRSYKANEWLSGRSMLANEPLLLADMKNDPRVIFPNTTCPYLSQLSIPLWSSHGPLGTIIVSHQQKERFDADDIRVMTMLASSAVIALENASLYRAEQERRREADRHRRAAEGLRDILAVLNARRSLPDVLDYTMVQAHQLLSASAGVIYRSFLEGRAVVVEAVSETLRGLLPQEPVPVGLETVPLAILNGAPYRVSYFQSALALDPELASWQQGIHAAYHASLAVPLMIRESFYGALVLYYAEPQEFPVEDIQLAMALGGQVALAIENVQLYAEARRRTDELHSLFAVQQAITSRLDRDTVLQLIADEARRLTATEQSAVYMLHGDELEVSVISGRVKPSARGYRLKVDKSAAGLAVQSRQPVLFLAGHTPLQIDWEFTQQMGAHSFMVVPLLTGNNPLGTIVVSNKRNGDLGADDERVLTLLASSAVIGLENSRLYAETRRRLAESQSLQRVTAALLKPLGLEELLQFVCDEARRLIEATASIVFLMDDAERLQVALSTGIMAGVDVGEVALTDSLIGIAMAQEKALLSNSPANDPWAVSLVPPPTSLLVAPLRGQGAAVGALAVFNRPEGFTEEEIRIMGFFADQAAIAIEGARLRAHAEQAAVAAERNRLARDLHDAVTQTLFSASLIADVLPRLWERNPIEAQRRLSELRELTRGALAEMRMLLVELRPMALVEAELGDLLRQQAEAMIGRTRIPVLVEVRGQCTLPPDIKVAFYRIAQEALNNVVKHACAGRVNVKLELMPQRVELEIVDDGRGFDVVAIPADHLGVRIMRERAEAVGARFIIQSSSDMGTRVALLWQGSNECPQLD